MSKNEIRLIETNTVFYIVFSMFTSFLNVYLYAYTKSFIVMSWFVVVRMAVFPFCSIIGAKLSKKYPLSLSFGIGLFFLIISLIISLFCTDLFIKNPYYSLIVALVCGIGFGFYWFAMNLCSQVVPTNETRSVFIGKKTFFANITTMLAPLLSTFIIKYSDNDIIGYRNILILVVILSIVVLFLSFRVKAKADIEDFTLIDCLKFKDDNYKNVCLNTFFYGFNDALFLTLTGIMVSNAAKSGTLYSQLLTYFSILQIILSRLIPWLCKKERAKVSFIITAVINISSTIVLVLCPNMFGAVYYGITHAIYNVYEHMNSYFSGQACSSYPNKTEIITAKQTYNSVGRIIGMFFILICYYLLPEDIYLQVSVIILSLFPILVIYYNSKIMKTIYKK